MGPWTVEGMIDDYSWKYTLGYATPPGRCEGATCSADPFAPADVAEVLAAVEGENDGDPWIAVVRLRDGRFVYADAGCDYTGWDCQSGGSGTVSHALDNLVRFGLTDESRRRFLADANTGDDLRALLVVP